MAKLTRKTSIPFGSTAPAQTVEEFGAKTQTGFPVYTTDPAQIQQLAAWTNGWTAAIVAANKAPYVQDMNAFCLVDSYQLTYLFQEGIAEWDTATIYFINSYVQASGQLFVSLQDNNTGNAPPPSASNAFWRWINPAGYVKGASTLNTVPKVTSTSPTTGAPGSVIIGDSAISEDGIDVIITLPLKFPDGSIQSVAATNPNAVTLQSPPTAYDTAHTIPASGTRLIGTIYQNTGSKPRFVSVTVSTSSPSTAVAQFGSSAGFTPGTFGEVKTGQTSGTPTALTAQLFFIVLPGYFYQVPSGSLASPTDWVEWT